MRQVFAILGSVLFLVIAPGTVAGLVPWWISRWQFEPHSDWWVPLQLLGAAFIALGALVLLDSFTRFAIKGLGTPAPVFPPKHLIITGLYRHVRNPMYVAIVALIIGQGLIFANVRVLEYGALIWLAFRLFVISYEEPTLRKSFGPEYEVYCRDVKRWLPRLRP